MGGSSINLGLLFTRQENIDRVLALIDEQLKSYPASSFRLNKMVGNNWLAIGDAASAYDPITSQGIIKSLSDAILAAETIVKYLTDPRNKLEVFEQVITTRYQEYLSMRQYFYRLENRWADAPFWQKYQGRKI